MIALGLVLLGAALPVRAATRVALVIGNSAYEHAPELPNPVNDAEGVAAALARLGFEVIAGIDLDRSATEALLREFASRLEGADVSLFYYAGHGLQVGGKNYLVPVEAELERELDLEFETTDLSLVLRLMEREERVNLVFLDACRNNPLARNLARSMGASRSTAIGRGLARVESGVGTLITYATQPDNVALDGEGRHSPFTTALLEHIETPGLSVQQMLIRVRRSVLAATNNSQVPWDHSSLTGDFYFVPEAKAPPAAAVAPPPQSAPPPAPVMRPDKELVFWETVQDSADPADFEAYLEQYPTGAFARLAENRLARLRAAPSTEPAPDKTMRYSPPSSANPFTTAAAPSTAAIRGADRFEGQWEGMIEFFGGIGVAVNDPLRVNVKGGLVWGVFTTFGLRTLLKAEVLPDGTIRNGRLHDTLALYTFRGTLQEGMGTGGLLGRKFRYTLRKTSDRIDAAIPVPDPENPGDWGEKPSSVFNSDTKGAGEETRAALVPGVIPDISGTWGTNQGTMQFRRIEDGGYHATYDNDNGRIFARFEGNTLIGHWIEDGSLRECASPRDGSRHWGRIRWTFARKGNAFTGTWGYCEADPEFEWSGGKRD